MLTVTMTFRSLSGTPTIHTALRAKLGREPTHRELCDDVKRILAGSASDRLINLARQGKLPHQRKR